MKKIAQKIKYMKNLFNCLLLMFCFVSMTASGQNKKIQSPIFNVRSSPNNPTPDSIQVAFYKGNLGPHFENVKIQKKSDKSFSFSFSKEQAVSPFQMFIYYTHNGRMQIVATQTYYAEPSDRIEISVSKGSPIDNLKINGTLAFSGKGALKYKVAELLENIKNDLYIQESNKVYKKFGRGPLTTTGKIESPDYHKSTDFQDDFNALFESTKAGIKKGQDTLSKYEKQLGEEITTHYRSDLISYIHFINTIHWLYKRAKTENNKQAIADFYFSKIDSLRSFEPKSTGFIFGQQYTWMKGVELVYETYYKTKGKGFPFEIQYNALKAVQNLELRDVLITRFFEEPNYYHEYVNNSSHRDSCLKDALTFINEPELKAALHHQLLFNKYSAMPNFSFPDTTGKKVTLNDLRGNVCLLDFYFEGCGACAAFAKRFEKDIYPEFENRSDFKVVSINTDLNRKSWIRAIKSGQYTQPNSINLSTGSAGYNHPILKHYDITSFPWVLLLDKNNRVIAFDIYALSSQDIIRMIKEALTDTQVNKKVGK